MKNNRSKKSRIEDADVILTMDPDQHMTEPGFYLVMDPERGVTEKVFVNADGKARVIATEPIGGASRAADDSGMAQTRSAGGGSNVGHAPFELREFAIGKPFHPALTSCPEGALVEIWPDGIVLAQSLDTPTDEEKRQVRYDRFSMRLLTRRHTILFLAKFGDSRWIDAPFSVHRIPEAYRVCPPDPGPGYGWPLTVVLVDASTGLVVALRVLSLSRRFSCAVLRAFEAQKSRQADDNAHVLETAHLQRKSTARLAAEATERFEQGDTVN